MDKKQLNYLVLTPLISLSIFNFIKYGLGPYLITLDSNYSSVDDILQIQIVTVLFFPFQVLGYKALSFNQPRIKLTNITADKISSFYFKLKKICWFCLVFVLFSFLAGYATGSLNRAIDASDAVANGPSFNFMTLFVTFGAFTTTLYITSFLCPLILSLGSRQEKKFFACLISLIFILSLLTGTRGFIVYPMIYYVAGSWFFRSAQKSTCNYNQTNSLRTNPSFNPKKFKIVLIFLIPIIFILIYTMNSFRSNDKLSSIEFTDLSGRLSVFLESQKQVTDVFSGEESNSFLVTTGKALVTTLNDNLVYTKTPSLIPYAGWDGIDAVLYVWVPKLIFPSKPSLNDGMTVVLSYRNNVFTGGLATISFYADLYRRFGWIGVALGNFIFGCFYGFLSTRLFLNFNRKKNAMSLILILILISFSPHKTLLRTFQIWLFDFPKYVIFFFFILKTSSSRIFYRVRRSYS